jgi:hypothetical protein
MERRIWTAADLPDMAGRTVIVTGPSSGLGVVTARDLARAGSRVVLAVRDGPFALTTLLMPHITDRVVTVRQKPWPGLGDSPSKQVAEDSTCTGSASAVLGIGQVGDDSHEQPRGATVPARLAGRMRCGQ